MTPYEQGFVEKLAQIGVTGISVFDQNNRGMARQLNNWYMCDRGVCVRSLLYSLAMR